MWQINQKVAAVTNDVYCDDESHHAARNIFQVLAEEILYPVACCFCAVYQLNRDKAVYIVKLCFLNLRKISEPSIKLFPNNIYTYLKKYTAGSSRSMFGAGVIRCFRFILVLSAFL